MCPLRVKKKKAQARAESKARDAEARELAARRQQELVDAKHREKCVCTWRLTLIQHSPLCTTRFARENERERAIRQFREDRSERAARDKRAQEAAVRAHELAEAAKNLEMDDEEGGAALPKATPLSL